MDRLERDNRDLAASAAMWQERARVLADQLALPAPATDAPGEPAPADPSTTAPAPSRPVWVRWWPVLAVLLFLLAWLVVAGYFTPGRTSFASSIKSEGEPHKVRENPTTLERGRSAP